MTGAQASLRLAATSQLGDWIHALAWSPDSGSVAAACGDGAIAVLNTDGQLSQAHRHDAPATTVVWSAAGVLASGGQDGGVCIGDTVARAGEGWVERAAWRPDGGALAVAHGRQVQIYAADGQVVATSEDFPATVTCLAWTPRGVEIAAGSYGGVRILRAKDAAIDRTLAWKGSILELAISPDGKRLAHGNQDASVHFWNLRRDSELEMWGYETKVRELAWRHDGRWLATGGGDSVTVWGFAGRGPSGSEPEELTSHMDAISWLGFRPGSALLASTAHDGLAILWKPGSDDLPLATVALDDRLVCGAWSPDGRRLALGGAGGIVAITDVHEEPG